MNRFLVLSGDGTVETVRSSSDRRSAERTAYEDATLLRQICRKRNVRVVEFEQLVERRMTVERLSETCEEHWTECPMCPGEAYVLGTLGRLVHYRCRYCGMQFSQEVQDDG